MNTIDILVIDNGGRGHVLCWKIAQSPKVGKLFIAPGNGGTQQYATNVNISPSDIDGLIRFAKDNRIGVTIVGPEDPLANGIVDRFCAEDLRIFGPTSMAAQMEGSKARAKHIMAQEGIPTAPFKILQQYERALRYLREHGAPAVIKADGLATGKGAYPCNTLAEAEHALKQIMVERVHGKAGDVVVIEEFLRGQEVSVHAFCDGKTAALMPLCQDHKTIMVDGKELMTGGMGAYAPVPWVSDNLLRQIKQEIIEPVLAASTRHLAPLVGCLYPGLMIAPQGPMVLEVNVRFGDPEAQCILRLLKTDLLEIIEACIDGRLARLKIEWNLGFVVCVVLASKGYPGKPEIGIPITGIDQAERIPGVKVFHAGTAWRDNKLVTSGGRVVGVTAMGGTLERAIERVYRAVRRIHFDGMQHREDIGAEALSTILPEGG